jgi:aminoglycoside phosphotransferase (APT) family kinase protein
VRSRTLFGKVYHSTEKARSVAEQMQRLSDALAPGTGRLIVARVAGFLPDLPMVVQEPLAGVPLDLFLAGRTRGQSGVVMAASALAELHGLDVRHPRLRSVGDELRRMAQRSRSTATVDPELGARMADLAAALSRRLGRLSLESRERRVVHADCKPSQFLVDGEKIGLLDFDHAGMADPALDVGTFMASLRQRSSKACGSTRSDMDGSMRALECSFLDSYCHGAGVDADFRQRAAWYEAFALLRKAQRAFARSFRSPVPGTLVDEARRCLLSAEAGGPS